VLFRSPRKVSELACNFATVVEIYDILKALYPSKKCVKSTDFKLCLQIFSDLDLLNINIVYPQSFFDLLITDVFLQDVNEQWQTMFLITSSLYVFSTAFYLLCGSGQMQTWAMEPCRNVQTVESPSETLLIDRTNRPNSLISSPSTNQSPAFYNNKPSLDVYSSDTLRRNNQHELPKPIVNHLTPSGATSATVGEDGDTLNRKSSNKSTTSLRTKNDTDHVTRRTDHERDRDYHRSRQRERDSAGSGGGGTIRDRDSTGGIGGSAKRNKGPSLRPRPEDSLEIYESLSESPV